jgi:alkanesulfonate monooxygenase SsuD/methylene tetrahydromethanopterin reductase-like flavin-dependent oxidoreductase (luciferase family)
MRFGILQAAHCPPGIEPKVRYLELLTEAAYAEEMGFDFYSIPEQHFNTGRVTIISATDLVLSAIAARTSRMRLRLLSVILLPFNHPIRVAERVATLDILSNGRAELSTARSNHVVTMRAFQVPPGDTKAMWDESLTIVRKALGDDTLEHHGKFWDIAPVSVMPKPVQTPYPPMYYAATSLDGHVLGASRGLGVVGGNSLPGGWDYVAECAQRYKSAIAKVQSEQTNVTSSLAAFVATAHCAESQEQAEAEAAGPALGFVAMVIQMFNELHDKGADYAYMKDINKIVDRKDDMKYLIERAPYISVGTPDFHIERIKLLERMGYDEVVLRIDGMGHAINMRSIEMFGKYVMPAFKSVDSRRRA